MLKGGCFLGALVSFSDADGQHLFTFMDHVLKVIGLRVTCGVQEAHTLTSLSRDSMPESYGPV